MTIQKLPSVCIVGRTNVGKSSLFNALVGRRRSVVKDAPGVTRDRAYEAVTRWNFPFTLVDTGALVGEEGIPLHESVRSQTRIAMKESDLIIGVFDGLHGLHPEDATVVEELRNLGKPVIWVANKCEKPDSQVQAVELYGLGIDELLFISAAHRRGIRDLVAKMAEILETVNIADIAQEERIKVAIVGKPNVGKSTFINKLLGEDRLITSPIAGTTRDSISCELRRDNQVFELIDTAGLRRKTTVKEKSVERFSNVRTMRSIALSDVVVFLLDAEEGLPTDQDANILNIVQEKGKGLILVVNKWDLVKKEGATAKAYREAIQKVLHFVAYAPIIFISAKTGQRCLSVLDQVRKVAETGKQRIQTAEVNNLFERAFVTRVPPSYHGSPIKLLYATQVAVQPPTFAVFVNHPQGVRGAYERFLKQIIRKEYPFVGNEIRLLFKTRAQAGKDKRDKKEEKLSRTDVQG